MTPAQMSPTHDKLENLFIREISPQSAAEVELVACRMQATLIEVEGEDNAAKLHSLDWIRERVRWHLHNPAVCGKVLLATLGGGEIIGHTILRREHDTDAVPFGLISTTYVLPEFRRLGVATRLLEEGEVWFNALGLSRSSTWTSATNCKFIRLYEKHGYAITGRARHEVTGTLMVNLTKQLAVSSCSSRTESGNERSNRRKEVADPARWFPDSLRLSCG